MIPGEQLKSMFLSSFEKARKIYGQLHKKHLEYSSQL